MFYDDEDRVNDKYNWTQPLLDQINDLRKQLSDTEQELRNAKQEIKTLTEKLEKFNTEKNSQ